ncbi:cytochrome P450 [Halonotius sp. F2-221B]|uniref:cytochrome P450 n=1 Tax=Halonotius sp. F2-221B TaxID=2731620 RepID=UPI00398B5585
MSKVLAGNDFEVFESAPTPLKTKAGLHDPFDWYKKMRSQSPIHYDSQREVYDVFGFQQVKNGLQDNALVRKSLADNSNRTSPFSYIDNAIVWMDGSQHKRSKGEFFKYFRPGEINEFENTIRELTTNQLDQAVANGTEFDFVSELAEPLPLRVIMSMVGVPDEDIDKVIEWLLTFREVTYSEFSDFDSKQPERLSSVVEYFSDLVEKRRAEPQDDLISKLIEDDELDDITIGSNAFNFILAGQGTLTSLLANSVYLLDKFDCYSSIDQSQIDVVLEEILRYRSPLQARARKTKQQTEIGGMTIRQDETVILWIGSANRDPDIFDNPDTFISERDPDHIAFGSGSHTCIGAPLARLEASIILKTLFDYFEDITVRDSYIPLAKPSDLGFEKLPVKTNSK